MILNYEEISQKGLIQNSIPANFTNASYDLRVEEIITITGKRKRIFKIKPNSMVVVVSKESVVLPSNIIGHAYVRTRLSQRGIMANNIGIIDAHYNGHLSSVLVNFGKEPYEIKEDDTFLRITFSSFITPIIDVPLRYGPFSKETYLNERKSDAMDHLGNSFINIDTVVHAAKQQINSSYITLAKVIGIWVAAISFFITCINYCDTNSEKKRNEIKDLQQKVDIYTSNQNNFMEIQTKLEYKILILKKELDSLSRAKTPPPNSESKSK